MSYLTQLHPIWEERYSKHNPPPAGKEQRHLLRPVYWLGSWQFACLDYYHPPKGIENRCVRAEPFPPVLQKVVARIESIVRSMFGGPGWGPNDLPKGWHLNVCLINYYGSRLEREKRIDCARVGEHKDFEPGPVASLSFGERAMFQFVSSRRPGTRDAVVFQQWLDDSGLQVFGGDRLKRQLFHRVQRVDKKAGHRFELHTENFETRRINLTFRYVPDQHVVPFAHLPREASEDVRPYMDKLAAHSDFFREELGL